MANLDLQYKINIPFANNGDKDNIPDTSPDGLVNNTDGLGVKYELEIPEGGEYFERQILNGIFFKIYAAVKELQDLAVSAGFPIDMTKAINVLDVVHGGTKSNDGYLFKNCFTQDTILAHVGSGFSRGGTSQQFMNAFISSNETALFLNMVGGKQFMSDFPYGNGYLKIIKLTNNTCVMTAYDLFSFAQSERRILPDFGLTPWTEVRKPDGSIPTERFTNNSIPGSAIQSLDASKVLNLAKVATSGAYADLTDKPAVPPKPQDEYVNQIGYWLVIDEELNTTYRLPSGGSWAWFIILKNSLNNSIVPYTQPQSGISEGGANLVSFSGSGIKITGFAWRIQ